MKLLSFQPQSLYQNGGCGRVLRRLYQGNEQNIISIEVNTYEHKVFKGPIKEEHIFLFPSQKKWMRWKLKNLNAFLQKRFLSITEMKIRKTVFQYSYDVIHIVNQGILSAYLCRNEYIKGKKLWVSFHDHYSLGSSFRDTKTLWDTANRRLVISEELAQEYSKRFGKMSYEIITDGLKADEISVPKENTSNVIVIYFGGLLHQDYLELFQLMAVVLDTCFNNWRFKFILRGTQRLQFLDKCNFIVEYRNDFISDKKIKQELDEADILYLPMKFTNADFYKYSLSTKMVGYLGASGTILYHGPGEGAAYKLLSESDAAVCCTSLKKEDMVGALKLLFNDTFYFSKKAKELALKRFSIEKIHRQFWTN